MSQPINLQALELERFNNHASQQLLETNKLGSFLELLGCQTIKVTEGEHQLRGYKVCCPVCRQSACFVGLNGKVHKVYWHCYDKKCPSQNMSPKNLVSLVRRLRPDNSLKEAIFAIRDYLGYKRSYDITNGKLPDGGPDEENLPF
jgi:hypothetical protein